LPGVTLHDRRPSDVRQYHPVCEMGNRLVRIADGKRTIRGPVEQRLIAVWDFRTPAQNVSSPDDAGNLAASIKQWIGFVPPGEYSALRYNSTENMKIT
jgi:hypothetical protein